MGGERGGPQGSGIEALVLSAGASSRLGRPKALLDFGGKTTLERVLETMGEAGVPGGVVVVGESAATLAGSVDPAPFRWIENPCPEAGRTGSIRVGWEAIDPGNDVLLWPVDRPLASPATVTALLAARGGTAATETEDAPSPEAATVIVPLHDGGRGHPIVLPADLRAVLLAAPPDEGLREIIRRTGVARREVAVDDPGIHFDLDTEERYREALAWWKEKGALRRPRGT
jgi:CTP:molybdopterin cytidylyltransferase MocA